MCGAYLKQWCCTCRYVHECWVCTLMHVCFAVCVLRFLLLCVYAHAGCLCMTRCMFAYVCFVHESMARSTCDEAQYMMTVGGFIQCGFMYGFWCISVTLFMMKQNNLSNVAPWPRSQKKEKRKKKKKKRKKEREKRKTYAWRCAMYQLYSMSTHSPAHKCTQVQKRAYKRSWRMSCSRTTHTVWDDNDNDTACT